MGLPNKRGPLVRINEMTNENLRASVASSKHGENISRKFIPRGGFPEQFPRYEIEQAKKRKEISLSAGPMRINAQKS